MLLVDYEFLWERRPLCLCAERYLRGGGVAYQTFNVDDLRQGDSDPWATLSVNLPNDPCAATWCSQPGHFVLDTNNVSKELVDALVDSGTITVSDGYVHSGYCDYPLVAIPSDKLALIPDSFEGMVAELQEAGIMPTEPLDLDDPSWPDQDDRER